MIKLHANSDLTSLIKSFDYDRDNALQQVYEIFRDGFLTFSRQYVQDDEISIDCFQEAVISLYENLATGKITDQSSTIKTYLYAIGKYKLINRVKKENRQKQLLATGDALIGSAEHEQIEYKKVLISNAIDGLGQKCRDILTRFYYKRFSIEAIMIDMNYKNENTVKAHKSRCMSQLKEILHTTKNDE